MGCERYEIVLVDIEGQAKQRREWTEVQLLSSVAWLKRMNARGHDVLIRPATQSGLVLLGQLTHDDVARLEKTGVPYGAKIEAEPDRFQIWLKLGSASVSEKIAKVLSEKLELGTPEAGRLGMLAGFVRHRPEAWRERDRFVLSHEPKRSSPATIAKWDRMLEDAEKLLCAPTLDQCESSPDGRSR